MAQRACARAMRMVMRREMIREDHFVVMLITLPRHDAILLLRRAGGARDDA